MSSLVFSKIFLRYVTEFKKHKSLAKENSIFKISLGPRKYAFPSHICPDCTADENNVHKAPLQVGPFTCQVGGQAWTKMMQREGQEAHGRDTHPAVHQSHLGEDYSPYLLSMSTQVWDRAPKLFQELFQAVVMTIQSQKTITLMNYDLFQTDDARTLVEYLI